MTEIRMKSYLLIVLVITMAALEWQILELGNGIETLRTNLDAIQFPDANRHITSLESRMTSIENHMAAIETEVKALTEAVERIAPP